MTLTRHVTDLLSSTASMRFTSERVLTTQLNATELLSTKSIFHVAANYVSKPESAGVIRQTILKYSKIAPKI